MEFPPTTATVETLPNGLALILDPDPTAPAVSAQIWVETGSIHEDDQLGCGLSHFLEHMVFKGTRDYDADTLAQTVQAAGGHWNAYTTFDRTVYYIDGPAKSLSEFLKCLTGLVFFPTLPEAEFDREKEVIRREIDMGLDDPDNAATRLLLQTAFQSDPRRHPVIGHRHHFDSVQYRDLTDYHRRRYTTDRCFVVVSGDFDPESVRQLVSDLTASCQTGGGRDPHIATDPPILGPRSARETFAIPNSRISLAWKIPALDHPLTPAFDVLATLLGRGQSSRLYHALREQQSLALEISAFAWSFADREGLFGISADALPNQRDALVEAIHSQLAQINTDQLVSEIKKAKRQILSSQFRSLQTVSSRAGDLASNWHEARDLDFTRRHVAAIQRVTEEDVKQAASRLTEDRRILTLLEPLESRDLPRHHVSPRRQEKMESMLLPNGIQVALLPDHRLPLIHVQAAVRAGLPSETPATQGINTLLAATLTKGTTHHSAHELALKLESLGASMSAISGNNALLIQASGLSADLIPIASAWAEVIGEPILPADAIAREKASQLASLLESQQDPLHLGIQSLRAAAFDHSGYGLDALGSPESLESIHREHLVAHHARHFTGSNLTVAIAGDFDPAEARELLASKLGAIPQSSPWCAPPQRIHTGRSVVNRLPKKQAVLAIGLPGAAAADPQRHALAFIQEYASDMAGPLFGRIREELGLAYQIGATQFLGHDVGCFMFYMACAPEQVELAREELLAQIDLIARHGIPDDAFERVRSTVLSGLAIQQQSIAATARHAALNLMFGLPADENRHLASTYNSLTPDEVRSTARALFSCPVTTATILPDE